MFMHIETSACHTAFTYDYTYYAFACTYAYEYTLTHVIYTCIHVQNICTHGLQGKSLVFHQTHTIGFHFRLPEQTEEGIVAGKFGSTFSGWLPKEPTSLQ